MSNLANEVSERCAEAIKEAVATEVDRLCGMVKAGDDALEVSRNAIKELEEQLEYKAKALGIMDNEKQELQAKIVKLEQEFEDGKESTQP